MGVDRPSRGSEDEGRDRRPERGQPEQKPPERCGATPSRPERPQSWAERAREAKQRAVEAYRDRHNSMTAAERRQAVRDKHAQSLEEETRRKNRTPAEVEAEAKAYLAERKARIEAYERGDLPRSQLSRSERRDATQRKFDRFIAAEKATDGREATNQPEREQGRSRPDTTPTGQAEREQARSQPDRPQANADDKPGQCPDREAKPDRAPDGGDKPEGRDAKQAAEARAERAAAEEEMRQARVAGDRERLADAADRWAEADGRSEQTRWTTIAEEEGGQVRSFDSFDRAKGAIERVPGTELHHAVEQAQAKPDRSGFDVSRINSTDNIVRVTPEVHREISKHYSRNVPRLGQPLRDVLNGTSWEYQSEIGRVALDKATKESRDER